MSDSGEKPRSTPWAAGLGSLAGRSLLASTAIVFAVTAGRRSGGALTFIAIAGVLAILPGLVTGAARLRLLRLIAGGMTAVTGAVLTMQLDFMQGQPQNEGADFVGAMLVVALLLAAVGTWVSDWRISSIADAETLQRERLAATRHAEIVRLLDGRPSPQPRIRMRDLALIAVAARLVRR
ncbi:MAG TPA: hypothetical protein VFE45_05590 [Coriobacteriia bacterium]|nr:hypothetical protein [Coriobacteriia bacterium]